eukprot:CAMPEP_0196994668 /NCGR_PEP_ID=MMETSP1380-20130617/927_1 /TAXON_ID=5936 /ORGANISM="Euplotes crassus, Strain CT5" /LENGTH=208 /DNA_ID=CAMNT_0042410105 /DNA_START=143 /DNA_END=769 /DNA_ORIENTATION=-
MTGKLDTQNFDVNSLEAVMNIADKSFPILKTMGLTERSFKFTEQYCWGQGLFSGCSGFEFEFFLGWRIGNKTTKDFEFFNITIIPYVRGEGRLFTNFESWFTKFSADFASRFINIQMPTSNQWNFKDNVEYCFDANSFVEDPLVLLTLEATVKSCEADMTHNFAHPGTFDYTCSYGSPLGLTLMNNTETIDHQYVNLVPRKCITIVDG